MDQHPPLVGHGRELAYGLDGPNLIVREHDAGQERIGADRFGQGGRLWKQAAAPGSEKWNAVIDELIKLHFNIDPTLTIYEASRDLMRAMRAEWHDKYTLPSLWKWYQPSRAAHGSYWFNWTTADEVEWKNNYRIWMRFLNDYKNRGGHVTTGSDKRELRIST